MSTRADGARTNVLHRVDGRYDVILNELITRLREVAKPALRNDRAYTNLHRLAHQRPIS